MEPEGGESEVGREDRPAEAETPSESRLLAMLAHELRRPLAPIAHAVRLLELQPEPSGIDREVAEIVRRQLRQLTRLANDLAETSRFTRGAISLDRRIVDLRNVVGHAIETARPSIIRGRHTLCLTVPAGPLHIDADPGRLEQVATNLLENAARYTPAGGRIDIELAREGEDAVLRIRDDGIGMSPETLERAFDPYFRGERAGTLHAHGLGVGLSLSQRLVALHEGEIAASSEGAGLGSELVVRLPLPAPEVPGRPADEPADPATSPAADRPPEESGTGRPLDLLIVDDHPDMIRTLESLLALLGHEARTAQTGRSALAETRRAPPDAVLLDIGLPDIDGFEVARRMREDPALRRTVLIAMTGYGGSEERKRAYESGVDHHLVKPLDISTLRKILGEISVTRPETPSPPPPAEDPDL